MSAGTGAAFPSVLRVPALVVAIMLFATGCGVFVWGYLVAVGRSRTAEISVSGLYLLGRGVAPAPIRRQLLGSLAVEVVVGLVTASIRPFTSLAAGILVPVYGLGLCGLWAARYGSFPPRQMAA